MPGAAPHGIATVWFDPPASDTSAPSWTEAYGEQLATAGLPPESLSAINSDADRVVTEGLLGCGAPELGAWPTSRERSGVVVGAVQSGKTASMMAVIARALDSGVGMVIVLAGTRRALWLQTFDRLVKQLDVLPQSHLRRVLVPRRDLAAQASPSPLSGLYPITAPVAERTIGRGRPIICVAMKNAAHLAELANTLHETVYPAVVTRGKPFHVMIVDDEADDSSILDALAEPSYEYFVHDRKQTPRRIVDLWESRHVPGQTAAANLYATYIAYTATPQANFLQDRDNPLAPRDFAFGLRTPGRSGDLESGGTTYRTASGAKSWYTGGEVYYKTLDHVPLCAEPAGGDGPEAIVDAVRAYLVAAAVRASRKSKRLGPVSARKTSFGSRDEAVARAQPPMSMLIHPSAALEEHFAVAELVLEWSAGDQVQSNSSEDKDSGDVGARRLGVLGVAHDMEEFADRWLHWLSEYARGARVAREVLEEDDVRAVPELESWGAVRAYILNELVPETQVAVINSDPQADDRPVFDPRERDGWQAAPNLSTIFVSGNVMSRGLTLEGLMTTLFTRSSLVPLADTQMQMQRWFGYRGDYIDLCRVFMSAPQLSLFKSYQAADDGLRAELAAVAEEGGGGDGIRVLQAYRYNATGKLPGIQARSLWPGARPFCRRLNSPDGDLENQLTLAGLFEDAFKDRRVISNKRGVLLTDTLSLTAAAELLESMSFEGYKVGDDPSASARWLAAQLRMGLGSDASEQFLRAPTRDHPLPHWGPSPYEIAAYLRFWRAAAIGPAPGALVTGTDDDLWELLDPQARRASMPEFSIGLRFGLGPRLVEGPLAQLGVAVHPMQRAIDAQGELMGGWGARNVVGSEIVGDEYFDYTMRESPFPAVNLKGRPPGEDGLILFNLVARDDGAVSIAVAASLPLGGPDYVEARVKE